LNSELPVNRGLRIEVASALRASQWQDFL